MTTLIAGIASLAIALNVVLQFNVLCLKLLFESQFLYSLCMYISFGTLDIIFAAFFFRSLTFRPSLIANLVNSLLACTARQNNQL